jgi:hypothetical protein
VIAARQAIVSEAGEGKSHNRWLRNGCLQRAAVVRMAKLDFAGFH